MYSQLMIFLFKQEEEEVEEEGGEGKPKTKKSKKRSAKRGIFDVSLIIMLVGCYTIYD